MAASASTVQSSLDASPEQVGTGYAPLWRKLGRVRALRRPSRANTGAWCLLTTVDELMGEDGDTVFATVATLASEMGCGTTQARERLRAAEELGLIVNTGSVDTPRYVRVYPAGVKAAQSEVDTDYAARRMESAQVRARKADSERSRRADRGAGIRPTTRPTMARTAPRPVPPIVCPAPKQSAREVSRVAAVSSLEERRADAIKVGEAARRRAAQLLAGPVAAHDDWNEASRDVLSRTSNKTKMTRPLRDAMAELLKAGADEGDLVEATVDALMREIRDRDADRGDAEKWYAACARRLLGDRVEQASGARSRPVIW